MTFTIFGSAFTSPNDPLYSQAESFGKYFVQNNITICTGGYGGIMEAVSKGAGSENGKVIGITVSEWERIPNQYLTEEIKTPNLFTRLMKLIELGDFYLVFKGGTGTLVEISVALELMSKGSMQEKKIYFHTDFWKPVIETLKKDSEKLTELINKNVFFINSQEEVIF